MKLARSGLSALLAAALYGFALGSAHSELYAQRNLVKFPLLVIVTASVCAASWWIVARAFAVPLTFAGVQVVAQRLFRHAAILLASLSPAAFFVGRALRARDDGVLGEYDEFLALNVAFVAASGAVALVVQTRDLMREHSVPVRRSAAIVACWLALSLAVGGQAAFWMRPFFGFPATRGNTPPYFLGSAPDVRGAANFYEAVWQTITRPPLPERWPSGPSEAR